MSSDWYGVVNGAALEQGDVLLGYPIYTVRHVFSPDAHDVEVQEDLRDVVVLTQTCDIENAKVDELLLARISSYSEAVAHGGTAASFFKSKEFRRGAINGTLPAQSLLPKHDEEPQLPWTIVDFHHLYTSPKTLAEEFASAAGGRLRLLSPYKEHLAQAFARYIMRVGLPSTLGEFIRESA